MLGDPAPTSVTDAMLESSLASNTSGANPAWGVADPSTIYLFVLPAGTIEADSEGACCTEYDGYHYQTDVSVGPGVVTVPYALSCACPGFDGPRITDLQERTDRHEPRAGRDGDRSFSGQRSGLRAGGR